MSKGNIILIYNGTSTASTEPLLECPTKQHSSHFGRLIPSQPEDLP